MTIYYVKLYLATLAAFFVIDMLWLGLLARTFYRNQLGQLMTPNINWGAAGLFYLLFILGLQIFVIVPGLQVETPQPLLLRAALFGLITYATYDLTNLATLKGWPIAVTVVDLLWGMVLSTLVSYVGWLAGRWLA